MYRIAVLLLAAIAANPLAASRAAAQAPPTVGEAAPGFEDSTSSFPSLGGGALEANVDFSGSFRLEQGSRNGLLSIHAQIKPFWHIFSTTQPDGGPRRTEITVTSSADYEAMGDFVADRDPQIHSDPVFPGVAIEQFSDEVTWTAPIRLAENVQAENLQIHVVVNGQLCETGGSCQLISDEPVVATFAGYVAAPKSTATFQDPDHHITISGYLEPKVAAPGDTLRLVLTAKLTGDWHVYRYAPTDPKKISKPTLIVLRKTAGWKHGDVTPSSKPKEEDSGLDEEPVLYYHEGTVSWTVPISVPKDAQAGTYELAGGIGFQTCTPSACDLPLAADFQVQATVGKTQQKGQVPLAFSGNKYGKIAKEAAVIADARKSRQQAAPTGGGSWSDKSVLAVLSLAFVAGLLLNVMPCVLPVIGLKVMSFVQQAGGSRREILSLNIWFSLGLMTVFWILAGAAAFANHRWGEHFGDMRFLVIMIGIVFAFALSFLGVWEIPIPGFVGSSKLQGAAEKEGVVGAYSKGMLSTVLATPCAGPFLVPAVSWATAQPSWLTFMTFTSIGLGMAAPYLLIGVAPQLISFLPKPGAWMETFKQLMGFLLMATVVFLFMSVSQRYVIPTLTLLLGISIACWWIGKVPATADLATRAREWGMSLVVIAFAGVLGFVFLVPHNEIDWQPFSRVALDQHIKDGRTVLVDFTADWCPTCKWNEAVALNRKEVAKLVAENGVIAIKADKTHNPPDINQLLRELGNQAEGIPFVAIFPGKGGEPITLDGPITQQQVLAALERAGPSGEETQANGVVATGLPRPRL